MWVVEQMAEHGKLSSEVPQVSVRRAHERRTSHPPAMLMHEHNTASFPPKRKAHRSKSSATRKKQKKQGTMSDVAHESWVLREVAHALPTMSDVAHESWVLREVAHALGSSIFPEQTLKVIKESSNSASDMSNFVEKLYEKADEMVDMETEQLEGNK
jgi:hypothetical protein